MIYLKKKDPKKTQSKAQQKHGELVFSVKLSLVFKKEVGCRKTEEKTKKEEIGGRAGSADPVGVAGCQEKIRRLGQQLQRHSSWPSRPSRPSTWRSLMILWTTYRTFLVGQSNSHQSYGLNIKFDGLGSNCWSISLERKAGLKDPWTVSLEILTKCQIHAL